MGCLLEIRGGEEEGGGVNARKLLVWEDVVWVNKWADPFKSVTIHSDAESLEVVNTAKTQKTESFFDSPFGSRMRTDSKRK